MSERSLLARLRRSTDPGEEARAQRLANAFEVCGAGWFWETDADGCLTYISSTFVEALGVDPKSLIGRPIIDLVAADAAAMDAGNDARSLEFHLHARLPFFEATMPVLFPVGLHWWSLSGTPIFGRGQRFQGFSGIGTDLTDVRRSEDRAQHLARFDSLTGLANRATIRETLNDIATADSDARRYALMLLDLDHFKSVNDTLGHPIGDRLLEQVADRLRAIVGVHGRVGRLGGDEFAIIATAGDAALSFGKLAASVVDFLSQPYAIDGHHITVGASVGIAMGSDQGQCVDALIRNADLALYAAKAAGRGKVRFYRASMHRDAEERRRLENDLRQAIARGELSLAFQPIVDVASQTLVAFEALARWHHPVLGDIPPAKFIRVAEDSGLIEPLGTWVLRSATAAAADWPEQIAVAVNLSPLQFANPELATLVLSAVAAAGIAPGRLELEVTESLFLQETAAVRLTLRQLSSVGVRLTLDDFGTGYSSLGYLNRAPFSKIKIDRSFVTGASAHDRKKAAIIRAIVALAESFGMSTTAEGAETAEDLETVRALGCHQVQGFVFGRAVPADDANRIARTGLPIDAKTLTTPRPRRATSLRQIEVLYKARRHRAVLRNRSASGAMIEADWQPEIGERLHVLLPDGGFQSCVVRWLEEGRFGVLFDAETIAPDTPERPISAFERGVAAA